MLFFFILIFIFAIIFLIYYHFFKKTFIRGPFPHFGKKSIVEEAKSDYWEELKIKGKEFRESLVREEVSITSHDGLVLVADLYENPERKGVFILFHGYRSNSVRDFDCILEKYYSLGYSLLLPDQRSHGRSEGKYITYGIKERFDCKSWIEFTKERYGKDIPIYLDGLSMGATTVLMALGLNIDANLRGVIADSAFTSPIDIIKKVGHEDLCLPYFLFLPQMKIMCKLFAKFSLDEESTWRALLKNEVPVIFIHGMADELVPYEMVKEHFESGSYKKALVSVENATHGFSYIVNTSLVEKELFKFLEETN